MMQGKLGLGGYLYDALDQQVPVIGVAKSSFHQNFKNVIEVIRGESKKPLFITSIGIDIQKAASLIEQMNGKYRIPALLSRLDQMTKEK